MLRALTRIGRSAAGTGAPRIVSRVARPPRVPTLVGRSAFRFMPRRFLADDHHAEPSEPVKVIFVDDNGNRVVAEGQTGETLYECALRHGVPIPYATCQGREPSLKDYGEGPECRYCHMFISSGWFDRLPRMDAEENHQLDMLDERSRYSRLSCQIVLAKSMDGMVCALAPIDYGFDIC